MIGAPVCADGGQTVAIEAGTKIYHSVKSVTTSSLSASGTLLGATGQASFENETTREYGWEYEQVARLADELEENPVTDDGVQTTQGCGECGQWFQ